MYVGTKNDKDYGFYTSKEGLKNCIQISNKEHMDLIDGQGKGMVITFHKDKKPKLVKPKTQEEKYADGEITKAELNAVRISELETYLKDTDWYVMRELDTGEKIPNDVKQKRADARIEISDLK